MARWIRIFTLALLLPAYCFAAVHVEPLPAAMVPAEASQAGAEASAGPADQSIKSMGEADLARLVFELSDTSDDVCDHCIPFVFKVTAKRACLWTPPVEIARGPDAVLRRLLRPPRPA